MAATFVTGQVQNSNHASTTTGNTTFPGNTTTGNLIVVLVSRLGANPGVTVTGITDSQGNTYVLAVRSAETSDGRCVEIWYAKNITGGTTPTVTVTMSASTTWNQAIYEVTGASTTAPLDAQDSHGGTSGTSFTSSSAGVSSSTSGVFASVVGVTATGGQTFTAGGSYTQSPVQGGRVYYARQDVAGSLSSDTGPFTGTASSAWRAAVAVFKPDVAAGGAKLIGGKLTDSMLIGGRLAL